MSIKPGCSGVRAATPADGRQCAAIYAPYVLETAITFEEQPPGAQDMAQRIAAALATHGWFVLEQEGGIVGYAYGAPFQRRAAYRWSCEVSVYVERGRRRTGAGRALYESLIWRLRERGFRMAIAGMTLPNEASVGLHRALGFEAVGVYRRIGYKLGRWHDVAWVQRPLIVDAGAQDPPAEPR